MALIDTHAWISAAMVAVPLSQFHEPVTVIAAGAVIGAYFGAKADLDGWIFGIPEWYAIWKEERGEKNLWWRFWYMQYRAYHWDIYTRRHENPTFLQKANPLYMVHLGLDKIFHPKSKPGWSWWGDLGWFEVSLRLIALGFLYWSFQ
jgi:hypothetical protein